MAHERRSKRTLREVCGQLLLSACVLLIPPYLMVAGVIDRDLSRENAGPHVKAEHAPSVVVASAERDAVISEVGSAGQQPATNTQSQNAKASWRHGASVDNGREPSIESKTRPMAALGDTFAKIPDRLPAEGGEAPPRAFAPGLQIPDATVQEADPALSGRPGFNGGRTWVVQLSAQRTEEEAQSAFRAAQAKYSVLAGRPVLIRRKDQGGRGVLYAAQVGPLARDEANGLCNRIKSVGGSCFIEARPD